MIRKMLYLLLGMVLVLTGCGTVNDDDEGDDYAASGCLTCGETITWTSYGRYRFNSAGSDTTAWNIVDECGWHVHSGHAGGYGNTLQIASCAVQECLPETDSPNETDIIEDYCNAASFIPYLPFRATGNTEDATVDDDEPDLSCTYSEHGHSAWYYFEANRDGYVTASTSGSNFDTLVAAFQGSCFDLRQIDCDNDSGTNFTSEMVFPVSAGETYYLLVGSYGANTGGNLLLNVTYQECPSQDEGVVLVWAYQSFYGFRVRAGWTGSTREGIRIGSTLQEFLSIYPYFVERYNGTYLYENDNIKVRATFDQDERLEQLMVGHYFRN